MKNGRDGSFKVGVNLDYAEMTDSDVSACLERVRQQDEAAIRALITYMYPLVYKIVRSNLSQRGEEEDLVQMIMSKVFKNLDQFSDRAPFKHWVSRIAVNTCLNMLRWEKCRPEVRMADLTEEEAAVVENLSVSDETLDPRLGPAARDLVQLLVGCLKPEERLLIRLIYLEGLSVDEATQATGWSRGAVSMRVSRAKEKMRIRHENLLKGKNL